MEGRENIFVIDEIFGKNILPSNCFLAENPKTIINERVETWMNFSQQNEEFSYFRKN